VPQKPKPVSENSLLLVKKHIFVETKKTLHFMEVKKRLVRSNNKMIAGVCGGIAYYLGLDPTLIRVAYILLSVFTFFSGVIAYLILWIVIPLEGTDSNDL
jgi:phage shock protein PspC (stress-responsive transcriptional regulator)